MSQPLLLAFTALGLMLWFMYELFTVKYPSEVNSDGTPKSLSQISDEFARWEWYRLWRFFAIIAMLFVILYAMEM